MVLTIAAAIFVFGLLVLVHELGHFATAKWTGMRVDEFAIGFGPRLFSVKKGETVYSIRAVPLGGFNDIAGMDPANNDAGSRGYCEKPVLHRMIVILAGSIMNFILPIFLFFGIFYFAGVSTPNPEPVFGQVMAGKPAAEAGLQTGDRVVSLNGESIASWQEFVTATSKLEADTPAVITVERGGEQVETTVTPSYDKGSKRTVIGVNKFADDNSKIKDDNVVADLGVAERQIAHTNAVKARRDNAAVQKSLAELKKACEGDENTMPYLINAVKTYATLGEICGVMKEVFGEYQGGNAF